jgi:hypothetical protein
MVPADLKGDGEKPAEFWGITRSKYFSELSHFGSETRKLGNKLFQLKFKVLYSYK